MPCQSVSVTVYLSYCIGVYNFYRNHQYTKTGKEGGKDIASGSHPLYRAGKEENKETKRTHGAKLSYMAFSNLQEQTQISFIVLSMLLCIVLFNSIIVIP